MSLLDEYFTPCQMMDRRTGRDPYGGYTQGWFPGAEFEAAVVLDDSIQAQTAAANGVTGLFTVTVRKPMRLEYHDVFKRLSDNQIFRVTTRDDKATPDSASLNMRQVRAEEWELTDG